MKIVQTLCFSLVLLAPVVPASAQRTGPNDSESTFSIDKRTEMPGKILKPGKYSIQILDHLSDRMIVRVASPANKVQFVMLAVPAPSSGKNNPAGLVSWQSTVDGTPAVRGFVFPSGYKVEFVYPKSEAAALAKVNDGKVLAVDPDSEGRPALAQMSSEDMTVVHLWMLSLTPVGPDQKAAAVQAQAYQPPASAMPSAKQLKIPAPGANEVASVDKSKSEPLVTTSSQQTPRKRPAIAALPHTASELPLVLLGGLLSLFAAFGVRIASISRNANNEVG